MESRNEHDRSSFSTEQTEISWMHGAGARMDVMRLVGSSIKNADRFGGCLVVRAVLVLSR
jgi:hypothetical protein